MKKLVFNLLVLLVAAFTVLNMRLTKNLNVKIDSYFDFKTTYFVKL